MEEEVFCFCDLGEVRRTKNGKPLKRYRLRTGRPAHVLVPRCFGGKLSQIDVSSYEDYGRFTEDGVTHDVYAMAADWNRAWISAHGDWAPPGRGSRPVRERPWFRYYANPALSKEEILKRWEEDANRGRRPDDMVLVDWRQIGYEIAAGNEALPYPIKIAAHEKSVYEECPASLNAPD